MGTESGLRRRVKGLSEAEFRQRFGTEEVPGGAVPAALGQGLGLPGLRARGLCRAQGPRGLPVQPLQAPGRADRRHGVPLDQIAADHLVPGDLPSEPEQGRDELGRAGAAAGHPAADRLADEAQADGGDAGPRRRQAQARRPGRGRRRLSRRAAPGRQARPGCGRQDAVRRRGRDDGRAQAQAAAADGRQRLPQEGDRGRWPSATSPPAATSSPMACPAGRRSSRPAAATSRWSPAAARRPPSGCRSLGSTPHSATSRPRSPAPTITSAPSTPSATLPAIAWRFNRRFQLDTLTERLAYACARTAPHPYRVIIAG